MTKPSAVHRLSRSVRPTAPGPLAGSHGLCTRPLRFGVRGLVAGALALVLLAGCTSIAGNPMAAGGSAGGGRSGTAEPNAPMGDPHGAGAESAAPSSTELIAAALAAGDIDEPTSWLYRTWATFGDRQLPAQFVGAPEGHDTELLAVLPSRLDELPADIRAQVEPYFLRPTDPRSVHSARSDDPPGLRDAGRALAGGATARVAAPDPQWDACLEDWATEAVPGTPFRVWACQDLDYADIDKPSVVRDAIAAVATIVATYAPRMIADMGDVIPDHHPGANPDPRSDDLIDIYVVQPQRHTVEREGDTYRLGVAGLTASAFPYSGVTSSAFVLLPVDALDDPDVLAWSVVHELFHVLQYTHNINLNPNWLYDATADWASSYYLRGSPSRLIHRLRLPVKQDEWATSLEHVGGFHAYGAYVWPLFMEQEVGADSIFATWKALADEPKGALDSAVIKALDQQLPVAANYPEFAMRMLNASGLAGDPITPRFVDLDAGFPDGRLPKLIEGTLAKDGELQLGYQDMQGLSFRPYRVSVPDSSEGVLVKASGSAAGTATPTLEGVIRGLDDSYQRRPIAYHGDGDRFCVVEDMFLVLANPGPNQTDGATGHITLERIEDEPCTRIEVNHPEWLHPLGDGEIVTVDGTENDDKPDATSLAITVHDVDPELIPEYTVQVTVAGGTLRAPREFAWPLTDFTEVGAQQWRRIEPLPLDIDLTDANRPLTIDARLVRAGKDVDSHTPTAELRGERPCDADAGEKCVLAGDLAFTMRADYDQGPNIHPRLYAQANVDATLSVRLAEPKDEHPFFAYVDAGSTWSLTGSARFEECGTIQVETCPGPVTQTFAHAADFGADPTPAKLRFAVTRGSEFAAQIPVVVSSSGPWGAGEAPIEPIVNQVWGIGCPEGPAESASGKFWESGGSYTSTVFEGSALLAPGAPVAWRDGSSIADGVGTELVIDCSTTWGTPDFNLSRSGGSASITVTLAGTLRWVRAG